MRTAGSAGIVVSAALLAAAALASASIAAPADASSRLVHKVELGLDLAQSRFSWRGWFARLPRDAQWAPIWETVHVLEAANGLAAATGRAEDASRVAALARSAEKYWNRDLAHGAGGFSTFYASSGDDAENWFDDNGWLGLAFFGAYERTRDRAFLRDAQRALDYMLGVGWDRREGGIWWSTAHRFKAAEAAMLRHAPQYDAMYVRFLVDAFEIVPDERLKAVVRTNASRAERNASNGRGLFTHDWDGGNREVGEGSLQTHAATLEALAWAAALDRRKH